MPCRGYTWGLRVLVFVAAWVAVASASHPHSARIMEDGALAVDGVGECALEKSCESCTGLGQGCQWCEDAPTSFCFNSTSNKEDCRPGCRDATCGGDGSECGELKTCAACAGDAQCGWCSSSQTCVRGDASGDCLGTCQADKWSYGNCTRNCYTHDGDCDACSAEVELGCFWCADNDVCFSVEDEAPCSCERSSCSACASLTTCGECTANPDCGFCEATQQCLPAAGEASPCNKTACPDRERNWLYDTCMVNCTLFGDSCATCTAQFKQSGCRWCDGAGKPGRCVDSHEAATCAGCVSATCPDCSAHTVCGDCTQDPLCGWCSESDLCLAGGFDGPCGVVGEPGCSFDAWQYQQCGVTCAAHDDCGSCADADGCGWCVSPAFALGRCIDSAFSSECSVWSPESCSLECDSYQYCQFCTANASCGWCEYSDGGQARGACVVGAGQGPRETAAHSPLAAPLSCDLGWVYGETCDLACSHFMDCPSCSLDTRCGWCADNGGYCTPGDNAGPSSGTCNAWTHYPQTCTAPTDPCASESGDCSACIDNNACGYCHQDNACYLGEKSGPLSPHVCPTHEWAYTTCSEPSHSPPSALSPWLVALLTAGALLIPIAVIAAYLYKRWMDKYGFPPLELE